MYKGTDTTEFLFVRDGAEAQFRSDMELACKKALSMEEMVQPDASTDFWDPGWAYFRPYDVSGGILTIPVKGALLSQFPYAIFTWATGYEYIQQALIRGAKDADVKTIVLDFASGGGTVAGMWETVEVIEAVKAVKPVVSHVDAGAYSAAFALAVTTNEIVVSASGGTGSVGVIVQHFEFSKALEQQGVTVTDIYAGKFKTGMSSTRPLDPEVREKVQARVDKLYAKFVGHVAANMNLSEETVRGTEAWFYDAEESISIGFANRLANLREEMLSLTNNAAQKPKRGAMKMKLEQESAPDLEKMKADSHAEGVQAGKIEGAKAEKARLSEIMGCEAAKGREKMAVKMALTTDLDKSAIESLLGDYPVESATAEKKDASADFNAAMERTEVGAVGTTADAGDAPAVAAHTSILNSYRAFTGAKKGE